MSGVGYLILSKLTYQAEPVACTLEAKLCPGGSYVGRIGPDCEFAACPSETLCEGGPYLSYFANDYIEDAITDYLLTQKHFSWKTKEDSRNFCVVENLNPEDELFPLYVWARCGEFIIQDDELKEVSGMSGPTKINYPNEMSFYDLNRFSYEAPGDGSRYSEDIKRIFPENVQQRIFGFNRENINIKIEALAINWFIFSRKAGN